MAERRMFSKTIIDSDHFLDMPLSTQCLYFHLSMRADDEGFINNPKKILRMIGAAEDDLKVLISKQFIIPFESGVVVIKHWKIHNYIQNDRKKDTLYQEERAQLVDSKTNGYSLDTGCIQSGYKLDTQDRLGEVSVGEVRLGQDSVGYNTSSKDDCSTGVPRKDIESVLSAWNSISSLGIPAVKSISSGTKRHDMLVARIKQYGVDDVLEAISKASESDFLLGRTPQAFKFTFDWFVKPNNFLKVLEGNYDNRPQTVAPDVPDRYKHIFSFVENNKENDSDEVGGFW